MEITREEVKSIVSEGVTMGVKQAFRDIGIKALNDDDAFKMRRDFEFLRTWREMCEAMRTRGFVTAVTLGITAMGTVIFLGIKTYLSSPL